MNKITKILTSTLAILAITGPAHANSLRDQHFNPPSVPLDQCEAFEASADWVEYKFNSISNARVVKGNTVYLAARNNYGGGCKGIYRVGELGQSFERGGYAGGTGEYHMEQGSLVFYSNSNRYGRVRTVLEAQY